MKTQSSIALALTNLASVLTSLGRYPEATAALEESLATLRRTPEAHPKDLSAAMGNLGELGPTAWALQDFPP